MFTKIRVLVPPDSSRLGRPPLLPHYSTVLYSTVACYSLEGRHLDSGEGLHAIGIKWDQMGTATYFRE